MSYWQHFSSTGWMRQMPGRNGRLVGWLLLVVLGATCTGFGPPILTDGGYPPLRLGPDETAALARLAQPPQVTAAAALVFDVDAGQILYALHSTAPRSPASTAKIMTALLVLQHADIDATVTVSVNAAATPGSRMGLVAGEMLSVRDLLYGLLVVSGNDAAVALAEYVSGSADEFVAQMNVTAAALGLSATQFANPHGLDESGATTSAADLVAMTQAALAYPVFAEIVAQQSSQAAGHVLTNTNELLGSYPGADGIKTGTTDEAGECLVASVTRGGHRLLAVVLGSADRYGDVRALLDYAAGGWRWASVTLPDDALAWAAGSDGRLYRLQTRDAPTLFLPVWQWSLLQPIRRLDATAALTGTLPVGQLEWFLGNQIVATTPLSVQPGP